MTTPMFQQFHQVKKILKNEILFFRMGDFYEMFYEDAKTAAKVLGLALTARSNGCESVPMAGIPFHAANTYLKRLIQAGYKVAICDQVEDPKQAKGLVKRELTRVITPGTLLEEDLLEEKKSNYLLSLFPKKDAVGLSWLDISTGEFFGIDLPLESLLDEVGKISPAECLLPEKFYRDPSSRALQALKHLLSPEVINSLEDWHFDLDTSRRKLKEVLGVKSLNGFGIKGSELFLQAAGALLEYLQSTQQNTISHIRRIQPISPSHYMHLDMATQRTLELVQTMSGGEKRFSLLGVLDRTETPMGGRMLHNWVLHPLSVVAEIHHRQGGVAEMVENRPLRENLREALDKIYDLERLSAKISTGHVTPRDLVGLRTSLQHLPQAKEVLKDALSAILKDLHQGLDPMEEVRDLLERAVSDHPPLHLTDGGVIREGFHTELDELRTLAAKGEGWLKEYQEQESIKLEIPSLKVSFNNVFGYYIEVTHVHGHKVPDHYIRKQTLKNAERYITPELKEYEEKVLSAREKALEIEERLFLELREDVASQVSRLLNTARAISVIDCLLSLARVAVENNYTLPEVVEDFALEIRDGRHPVLETTLQDPFVPNDVSMDPSSHVFLITGPNMAGKSTYVRQVALITLMAQMGGFVPARLAKIGVVDKLFTRLGSTDELYLGYSTFMVEMLETANILNNATSRSLVLLDEVGRGTSTYDGVSLAWAISEHLHEKVQCRTLFATHYHELTQLPESFTRMANFSVSLKEWKDEIVFLHKIEGGPTTRSYGIHVAKLAGMPLPVVARAEEILKELEENSSAPQNGSPEAPRVLVQIPLFKELEIEFKVLTRLRKLNLDDLTPLQALGKLKNLQDMANKGM